MSFMVRRSRLAFPLERDISEPGCGVAEVIERDAYRVGFPWEDFWRNWD
jgi:hypothetical protein